MRAVHSVPKAICKRRKRRCIWCAYPKGILYRLYSAGFFYAFSGRYARKENVPHPECSIPSTISNGRKARESAQYLAPFCHSARVRKWPCSFSCRKARLLRHEAPITAVGRKTVAYIRSGAFSEVRCIYFSFCAAANGCLPKIFPKRRKNYE